MWIILDAYAITSLPIENMHCIIGVYVFLQHIDAHSTYRMSYFEDDATYTCVIPCHPHIQGKTYLWHSIEYNWWLSWVGFIPLHGWLHTLDSENIIPNPGQGGLATGQNYVGKAKMGNASGLSVPQN